MAKPELGQKHECDSCGARFYDLGRVPATCPKCGDVSTLAIGAIPEKRRRRRSEQIAAVKKKDEATATISVDEDEDEEEDEVEELDLDDAQAERHLSEAGINPDGDDEADEADPLEVEDLGDDNLPDDEVDVIAGEDTLNASDDDFDDEDGGDDL